MNQEMFVTDTKYISVADTAKLVRAALKRAFPTVKFGVRSEKYSMGTSVNVSWTDGPSSLEVDRVVGGYKGSGFDGMIDLAYSVKAWLNPDGTVSPAIVEGTTGSMGQVPHERHGKPHPDAVLVHFQADHISTSRSYSEAFLRRRAETIAHKHNLPRVPRIVPMEQHGRFTIHPYCVDEYDLLVGDEIAAGVVHRLAHKTSVR